MIYLVIAIFSREETEIVGAYRTFDDAVSALKNAGAVSDYPDVPSCGTYKSDDYRCIFQIIERPVGKPLFTFVERSGR